MSSSQPVEIAIGTSGGAIRIRSFCSAGDIQHLTFARQFGTYAQYKSLYTKKESLEQIARKPDANVTLAVADNRMIVGFGVLAYPDAAERWAARPGTGWKPGSAFTPWRTDSRRSSSREALP